MRISVRIISAPINLLNLEHDSMKIRMRMPASIFTLNAQVHHRGGGILIEN